MLAWLWRWLTFKPPQIKATDEDVFVGPYRAPGEKEEDLPIPPTPEPKKPSFISVWFSSIRNSLRKVHQNIMYNWTEYLFALTLATAIGVGFWTFIRFLSAPGAMTHCYVAHTVGQGSAYSSTPFALMGSLEMQPDDTLGRFATFDEAVDAAKKINCELK